MKMKSLGLHFCYEGRRGLLLPLFILPKTFQWSMCPPSDCDMMKDLMWWMGLDCQWLSTDAFNARFQPKTNIFRGTWTVSQIILLFLCLSLPSSVMLFAGCSALLTWQAEQSEDCFYIFRCFSVSLYIEKGNFIIIVVGKWRICLP